MRPHPLTPPSRVQKWAVRMWGLGKVRRHASLGSQEGVGVGWGGGGWLWESGIYKGTIRCRGLRALRL
jgi:hypothetical protein